MKYTTAKKLHNADGVIDKNTNASLYVVQIKIDIDHRDVYVLCDDGNWYHHRTLI